MTAPGRVLIVDDLPLNVEILCKVLRKHYELATAENGLECLEQVARFQPQVVLLDIMMPGINGYETCRRIKAGCQGQFVQVILVSGKASPHERLEGYDALADDYVVKPFHHDELLSKVRVQMRLWEAQRELANARDQLQRHAAGLEQLVAERTRQLVETQDSLVFALARLTESRDSDTGNHLQRMRAYSMLIAQQLREAPQYAVCISDEFLHDLYRAAPLHDVGKVGVPDAILLKPGRLTPDEFEVMKQHVALGAETLDRVRSHCGSNAFLTMAAEIARFHHEWYDGRGYLAGASGVDIPLAARIVAVADVFDALTSTRPYKRAYSHEVAREMVLNESGTHFDPGVVAAFHACFPALVAIDAVIDNMQSGAEGILDPHLARGLR